MRWPHENRTMSCVLTVVPCSATIAPHLMAHSVDGSELVELVV